MASTSLEVLAHVGISVLVIAALTGETIAGTAIDFVFGQLIFAVDGKSLVDEVPAGSVCTNADFVRAEKDDQITGLAFACFDGSANESWVLGPKSEAYAGIALAEPKVVHALGGVIEVAKAFETEDHCIDHGQLVHLKQARGEDFSILGHVLVKSRIAFACAVCKTFAADARRIILASCAEFVAEIRCRQTGDSLHLSRHVFVELDSGFLFELGNGHHNKNPRFLDSEAGFLL